uniref:Cobyrinic acid ac-diamide synthase n=1 Tax=uncultured organism TaxID=155900 RepID=M1PPM3_9ZZZZ|nr:cobyrinic acid ac-diamide synthase [uncultured organism]
MDIVIASGKGGTGKTLIATNLAVTLKNMDRNVTYLDCDVEEPDGHLFLKPEDVEEKEITLFSPDGVDQDKCINCGKCVEACSYNAIAMVNEDVLFFPELCHICGACSIVCPTDAIIEREKKIGDLKKGRYGEIDIRYATLETGEGGMSPRLIKAVKDERGDGINILDSPPGTACPAVESIAGADLAVLVADPTPFGLNDLKLSVDMCRSVGIEPVVIVNRAEYRDDSLMDYCDEEGLEIIGEIPDDRSIAEIYSDGDIIVDRSEKYNDLFRGLAENILEAGRKDRSMDPIELAEYDDQEIRSSGLKQDASSNVSSDRKELVIISGKGGTGKTSLTAAFASLADNPVISDCDVDAADLHLLTDPEIKERGLFSGGYEASIIQDKCTSCGKCYEECRFDAIHKEEDEDGKLGYNIDALECEGCGVCDIVCQEDAIELNEAINGEWYVSDTRFGDMSHAKLGMAEENTGRLVTLVRENAEVSGDEASELSLIDGAPGTGCPVIASLTGSDFALVVTEPTVSGIHDMKRVLDVADHFGIDSGIVVNKSDLNKDMTQKIKNIAVERGIDVLGEIPYDNVFTEAQMERKTVIEYSDDNTSDAIRNIWNKVRRDILEKDQD